MVQIPNKQTFLEYMEPVLQNPVYKGTSAVIVEMVKIIAAKIFLEFLARRFLNNVSSEYPVKQVYMITIFAPIAEEILFRGFLLQGIHLAQIGRNYLYGLELTDEDFASQQVFRVHLSAIIFGALHLMNPHERAASALVQFTWSYFGGVAYGYLSEKYGTLSVSILAHGMNNTLAVAGGIYDSYSAIFLLAIFVNKIAVYQIAATSIDEKLYAGLLQTAEYCADLPGRFMGWDVQEALPPKAVVV